MNKTHKNLLLEFILLGILGGTIMLVYGIARRMRKIHEIKENVKGGSMKYIMFGISLVLFSIGSYILTRVHA